MKVSELAGAKLDYWVGKALMKSNIEITTQGIPWPYSTEWKHGGPIIERMTCDLFSISRDYGRMLDWYCGIFRGQRVVYDGATPLIAAMRAYVASVYGDEVPDAEQQQKS